MITTASKGSENINNQIEWTSSDKEAKSTVLVNNEKPKARKICFYFSNDHRMHT